MIDKDEEKLYNITMNTQNNNTMIVSNHVGVDGESVDRIYGDPNSGNQRLIQKDYTTYNGTISKKMIMVKGTDGNRFKSHVFVTQDDRWFNRSGLPITKPTNLENETETKETTEEEEKSSIEKASE
jgi:hypothetical protein|tara:strand:- start:2683 stop:3060 length:378 start_codon:yes stop_codon:yes gene_type:complete